jgi:hypothetical protein
MSRRVVRAAGLAVVVALLSAGAALAAGRGTVTITTHAHNVLLFSEQVANRATASPALSRGPPQMRSSTSLSLRTATSSG